MRSLWIGVLFGALVLVGCSSGTTPPASTGESSAPPMVASGAPAPPQDGEPANPGNAPPGTEASGGPAVANGRPPGVLQLQKQLDLTEDQMKDIDQIIARHRKDHDRKAGFAELEKILTPEQKAKWDAMRAEAMKRPPNQPRIKGGP